MDSTQQKQLERLADWAQFLEADLQACEKVCEFLDIRFYGTEFATVESENLTFRCEYLNSGDTYNPTLLQDEEIGKVELTTLGDWIEESEKRLFEDEGLIRCCNCGKFTTNWEKKTICEHCERDTSNGDRAAVLTEFDLGEFTKGYIDCAIWSSTDDKDTPLDENYGIEDMTQEALKAIAKDCAEFIRLNRADIDSIVESGTGTLEQMGHDYWLTRNRHGAGYWENDYGTPEQCRRLTDSAKSMGSSDLYVTDNNEIDIL